MKIVSLTLTLAVVLFVVGGAWLQFDLESFMADVDSLNCQFGLLDQLRWSWQAVIEANQSGDCPAWLVPIEMVRVTFVTIKWWFQWMSDFTHILTPWNYLKPMEIPFKWGVSQ